VDGAVVGAAERDEIARSVGAAVGARPDVVDVEVERVSAARDLAAAPVALDHSAAHGGRNGRSRAKGCYR